MQSFEFTFNPPRNKRFLLFRHAYFYFPCLIRYAPRGLPHFAEMSPTLLRDVSNTSPRCLQHFSEMSPPLRRETSPTSPRSLPHFSEKSPTLLREPSPLCSEPPCPTVLRRAHSLPVPRSAQRKAGATIRTSLFLPSSFYFPPKARAYMRICFTMASRPLERVGERCSRSPMRSIK